MLYTMMLFHKNKNGTDVNKSSDKMLIMSPHLRGGWHTEFGMDPVGFGITLSCLHNILRSSGWILTKFSCIYNWDITKNWLDFCDIDQVFKVTAVEKLKIHSGWTSVFS